VPTEDPSSAVGPPYRPQPRPHPATEATAALRSPVSKVSFLRSRPACAFLGLPLLGNQPADRLGPSRNLRPRAHESNLTVINCEAGAFHSPSLSGVLVEDRHLRAPQRPHQYKDTLTELSRHTTSWLPRREQSRRRLPAHLPLTMGPIPQDPPRATLTAEQPLEPISQSRLAVFHRDSRRSRSPEPLPWLMSAASASSLRDR